MKTIKVILGALMIVVSAAVEAGNKKDSSVVEPGSAKVIVTALNANAKFNLIYVEDTTNTIKVKIYDEAGRVIFTDMIKATKSFIKPYSLAELPKGDYKVEVSDGFGISNSILAHGRKARPDVKVDFITDEATSRIKMVVRGSDVASFDVAIYDHRLDLIHSDEISGAKTFAKTYDFSKISVKDVYFSISSEGESVSKSGLISLR
ncbi:MAG: hypothetical protein HC842_09220 [Cytophagales bacterium]|nr:hypothetical protein [Cytophagales bacterium]